MFKIITVAVIFAAVIGIFWAGTNPDKIGTRTNLGPVSCPFRVAGVDIFYVEGSPKAESYVYVSCEGRDTRIFHEVGVVPDDPTWWHAMSERARTLSTFCEKIERTFFEQWLTIVATWKEKVYVYDNCKEI